jgi:hypothetical protein
VPQNQYITNDQFKWVLDDLNYEASPQKQQELLDRATGALEGDLVKKFYVPLVYDNAGTAGAYASTPAFARNKILNCMKAKVRELIGYDKNRNLTGVIESTQKFINVHADEYKSEISGVMNNEAEFQFLRLPYAQDAKSPVQHLGLARPNDRTDPYGRGDWD